MALQRFYNAADKLVNAFIMGNIKHGDMCSCAVGNLCDGRDEWWGYHETSWTLSDKEVFDVIDKTLYSPYEIFHIEKNFEGRMKSLLVGECRGTKDTLDNENDPDGFKGLCNVFDYLVSIEDWNEEEKGANIFELLESVN